MRPALYRPLRASLPRAARHAVASTSARKAGPSFSTTASVEGAAIESSISANPARRVEFATSLRKRASRIAEMIHSRTLLMKRHHKKSLHPSSIPEFTRLLPRSVRRKMDKDAYLEEIDRRYKEQKLALRTHFPHMVDKCTSRAMKKSMFIQGIKYVPIRERVMFWNIRVGDQVRLLTHKEDRYLRSAGDLGETLSYVIWQVTRVDKVQNKLFLRQDGDSTYLNEITTGYHNVQVLLDNDLVLASVNQHVEQVNAQRAAAREAALEAGEDAYDIAYEPLAKLESEQLPVQIFARRLHRANIRAPLALDRIHDWELPADMRHRDLNSIELARETSADGTSRRFEWDRVVENTFPSLKYAYKGAKMIAPWPKKVSRTEPARDPEEQQADLRKRISQGQTEEEISAAYREKADAPRPAPNAHVLALATPPEVVRAETYTPPVDDDLVAPRDELAMRVPDAYLAGTNFWSTYKTMVESKNRHKKLFPNVDATFAASSSSSVDPLALPMELFASKELANPFSKPKLRLQAIARQQERDAEEAALIEETVANWRERERRVRKGLEPRVGRRMTYDEVVLTTRRRFAEMVAERWRENKRLFEERDRTKQLAEHAAWGAPFRGKIKTEMKQKRKAEMKKRAEASYKTITLVPAKNQVIPEGAERVE